MATGDRDDVEQVAMFAGGGVGPFTRRAASVLRSCKTDIEAAPRRVAGVADQPITALAIPLRQIVTTHRLGLIAETVCEITALIRQTDHHAAARSPTPGLGQPSPHPYTRAEEGGAGNGGVCKCRASWSTAH